jgi:hypothetical protein
MTPKPRVMENAISCQMSVKSKAAVSLLPTAYRVAAIKAKLRRWPVVKMSALR